MIHFFGQIIPWENILDAYQKTLDGAMCKIIIIIESTGR